MRSKTAKRLLDLSLTLPAVAALSPVMAAVGIAVWRELGHPVLFSQDRPGLKGRVFRMYKFRTMSDARDERGSLLPDAERLGRLGCFLRSTSLDELPELLNVLRGDMSLVGPRPLLVSYLERYTEEQKRRHEVPPGVTGLAQVRGRNLLSWDDKFALDVEYVDSWSVWLDIKIIFETIGVVLGRRGVAEDGQATMSEYMGPGAGDASGA
jgi:sugar transferase EpsL